MLRFGPDSAPVVVMALPLFEEANRTRAFAVTLLRMLAERGIAGALPDLPGQGESLVALPDVGLADLRSAFSAAVASAVGAGRWACSVAIRSGALVDGGAPVAECWHLSPQDGPALRRELDRIRAAEYAEAGPSSRVQPDRNVTVTVAGNRIGPALLDELAEATFAARSPSHRIVRLASDPAEADRHVAGTPLWRRSEPGNDITLCSILADDIEQWIATCAR
jgi:hypothetical protein